MRDQGVGPGVGSIRAQVVERHRAACAGLLHARQRRDQRAVDHYTGQLNAYQCMLETFDLVGEMRPERW
jgi:hypothetical protein